MIMKTTMKNSAFLGIVLFAALSFTSVAKANESKDSVASKIELKYIGKVENQPLFLLSFNSAEADEYTVRFRDNYGYVFYTGNAKNGSTQRYVVNIDEMNGNTVVVEVKSKKTKKTQTFTIGTRQTFVDETVVAKLD
jgi:hypothetical protein